MLSATKIDGEGAVTEKPSAENDLHLQAMTCGQATTAENDGCQDKTQAQLFHVDRGKIRAVPLSEQAAELKDLDLFSVYDQSELEQGILQQVDSAINAEQEQRVKKQAEKELNDVLNQIRVTKQEIVHIDKAMTSIMVPSGNSFGNKDAQRKIISIKSQKNLKDKQLKRLRSRHRQLLATLSGTEEGLQDNIQESEEQTQYEGFNILKSLLTEGQSTTGPTETEEERLIRLGEMTPFGTTLKSMALQEEQTPEPVLTDFEKYMLNQDAMAAQRKNLHGRKKGVRRKVIEDQAKCKKRLKAIDSQKSNSNEEKKNIKRIPACQKKKPLPRMGNSGHSSNFYRSRKGSFKIHENWQSSSEGSENGGLSEDEYVPDADDWQHSSDNETSSPRCRNIVKIKSRKQLSQKLATDVLEGRLESLDDIARASTALYKQVKQVKVDRKQKVRDDANKEHYYKRLRENKKARLREKQAKIERGDSDCDSDQEDTQFEGGWRLPQRVWTKLYRYQKTGVKWLWELHQQECGGIVGDEMGLGKTIQMICFLAGLKYSKQCNTTASFSYRGLGPVIIICPTTVMHQWLQEFHTWWPQFRVSILHDSGSFAGSKASLVQEVIQSHSVLVTSYSGARLNQDILLKHSWHYVILDEGHKIRNPNAAVTVVCKQFRTPHRLILSGAPVQNNLKELWSLFDFVFPGKLGTLPDFLQQFSVPITIGGYANATAVQVQTAYKCACVLRDTINPYLLRRMKEDVKSSMKLPDKNEQVLFCRLTDEQRATYKEYLESKECQMILNREYQVFAGLITLRKICNHPDLSTGGPRVPIDTDESTLQEEYQFGYWKRSGKMIVVESLLKIWKEQKHKVLLFSQSKQMLDILEFFVKDKYDYMRMDGGTPIASRQPSINKFNNDPSIFVFLLTTRVGGIGVNLTGANRVVIFDPDWNPSTDIQARERAWRIGQNRHVTIYRLLTTGSIEEKIYHRQIFKQFLTNRVLKDPKQRRFFKSNDLFELFTLGSEHNIHGNETNALFAGTGANIDVPSKVKSFDTHPCAVKKESVANRTLKKSFGRSSNLKMPASPCVINGQDHPVIISDEKTAVDGDPCHKNNLSKTSISYEDISENGIVDVRRCLPKKTEEEARNLPAILEDTIPPKEAEMGEIQQNGELESSPATPSKDDGNIHDWKINEMKKIEKLKKKLMKLQGNSRKKKTPQKKKTRQKKKKKVQDASLEGKQIAFLSRHSEFKSETEADTEVISAKQNDYVLQKLFKKTGVQSAMKHDVIMDSSNPDYVLVEKEAERVAKEAVLALKRSRRRCMPASSGIPTWTGSIRSSGTPGSMAAKPRFGLKTNRKVSALNFNSTPAEETEQKSKLFGSKKQLFNGAMSGHNVTASTGANGALPTSLELLSNMRARNSITDEDAIGIVMSSEKDAILRDLHAFIAFQASIDGQATTSEILEKFGKRIAAHDSAVFRSLLHQICNFIEVPGGNGIWQLKETFQ